MNNVLGFTFMVAKIMLMLMVICFFNHNVSQRSYWRLSRSADSMASGSGGGITKHTPGTWHSTPVGVTTFHLVDSELLMS
jgi:hypothetical protein